MRLREIFVSILLVSLSLNLFAAADDVIGFWRSEDGKGVVEVFKKDDKYHGKLVWIKDVHEGKTKVALDEKNQDESQRKDDLMGKIIMKGFKFNGKKWEDGTIYDPDNGKTYDAYMKLSSQNKLDIRGYIGFVLIGRTTEWQRQKSATPDHLID